AFFIFSYIAINCCKRQRRLTFCVWVNFEFLDEPDKHGNLLCKCKKCGTIYNADSKMGTGNLIRNIRNCKRRDIRDDFDSYSSIQLSGSVKTELQMYLEKSLISSLNQHQYFKPLEKS
ncbi:Nudix hydrolase 23 chloroplastic, partial [Bienertia sinuspersici]